MVSRKRSRGSKKSLQSSISSPSRTTTSKTEPPAAFEAKLKAILEQDEQSLIVYSVREELMQRVMDECYKSYLEKQCVKFTVHCACRALTEIVNLGLFHHDPGKPYYAGHPAWLPDDPPRPSPPDTWSAHKATIKPKPLPQPIPEPIPEVEPRESTLENVFTGISEPEEEPYHFDQDLESADIKVLYESCGNVEGTESVQSEAVLVVPHGTAVSISDEEDGPVEKASAASTFTLIARASPAHLPHPVRSGRTPLTLTSPSAGLPKISVGGLPSVSKMSMSVLPPIRANATFRDVTGSEEGAEDDQDQKMGTAKPPPN